MKKIKILIPNGTGPTNIGDQAILLPVIELLRKKIPNSYITLHTTTPHLYKRQIVDSIDSHLYHWTVFENRNTFKRIKRLTELIITYLLLKSRLPLFTKGKLKKLIEDYLEADLIIFIGGGYFRSQKSLSQSLNLLMLCTLFQFANLVSAKKIVTPISFGPFAYMWQERYITKIISKFDIIATREEYSFQKLKKYNIKNVLNSLDTALLLNLKSIKNHSSNEIILGFTIRKWLDAERQRTFEKSFIRTLVKFNEFVKITIQPIVQVDAPQYGDFDAQLTADIVKDLKLAKVKIKNTKIVKDLDEGAKIYGRVDILLGMRMHSNILAALYGTPFVAISYEYKTEGIAIGLGMKDYVIRCQDVNSKNLYALLVKAYKNRVQIKKTINGSLKKIRLKENEGWNNIFQSYARLS